jgi:hypothetical protein
VMEYYHDKLQLYSQGDSTMSDPMIIHHLINSFSLPKMKGTFSLH